jgi:hypothetical protein
MTILLMDALKLKLTELHPEDVTIEVYAQILAEADVWVPVSVKVPQPNEELLIVAELFVIL